MCYSIPDNYTVHVQQSNRYMCVHVLKKGVFSSRCDIHALTVNGGRVAQWSGFIFRVGVLMHLRGGRREAVKIEKSKIITILHPHVNFRMHVWFS